MKIILASTSPRRKELMDLGRFDYEILVSDLEEMRNMSLSLEEQSKDLAYQKAKIVYDQTTLNMIQDISSIIARKPMIIGEI